MTADQAVERATCTPMTAMKAGCSFACLAAALLCAEAANAAPPVGFEASVAVGYAVPSGYVPAEMWGGSDPGPAMSAGDDLHVWFPSALPVRLSAGGRLPHLFVGGYTQYAPAQRGGDDITLGVEADGHLLPGARLDPWLGLGLGLELVHPPNSGFGLADSYGWLTNLQAGVDVNVTEHYRVGPFVGVAFGQFFGNGVNGPPAAGTSADHWWLSAGLRIVFDQIDPVARAAPQPVAPQPSEDGRADE